MTDSADPNAPPRVDGDRVPLHRARTRAWSLLNFVNGMCLVWIDFVAPVAPFEFDVLPDELGFALFAFAAWRLRNEATAFVVAQWGAITALLACVAARFVEAGDAWSRAIGLVLESGDTVAVSIAAFGCAQLATRYDAVAIERFSRRAGIAYLGLTCVFVLGLWALDEFLMVLLALVWGRFAASIACAIAFARLAGRVERDVRSLARRPCPATPLVP